MVRTASSTYDDDEDSSNNSNINRNGIIVVNLQHQDNQQQGERRQNYPILLLLFSRNTIIITLLTFLPLLIMILLYSDRLSTIQQQQQQHEERSSNTSSWIIRNSSEYNNKNDLTTTTTSTKQQDQRYLDNGYASTTGSTTTSSIKGNVVCQLSDTVYRFRYDPYEQYYILDIEQSDSDNNETTDNSSSNDNETTRMSGGDGRHKQRQRYRRRRRLIQQQQQQRQQPEQHLEQSTTTTTISQATIQSQLQSLRLQEERQHRQQQLFLKKSNTMKNRIENYKFNSGRRLTSVTFPSTDDYASTNSSSNTDNHHNNSNDGNNQTIDHGGDKSRTNSNNPMHNSNNNNNNAEEIQYVYTRACLCTELFDMFYPSGSNDTTNTTIVGYIPKKRPIEYCLDQFDQCTVYRDPNKSIDCFTGTKTIAFVATFWPLAIVWMIGISYIVVRTESGRTTRQYIRRKIYCCRKYKHEVSILSHPQQQQQQQQNNNVEDDDDENNNNNNNQQQQSLLQRRRRSSSESSYQLSIPSSSSSQRSLVNAILPPSIQQEAVDEHHQQQQQQQDQPGGESDIQQAQQQQRDNVEQLERQQEEQRERDADSERRTIIATAQTSTTEVQVDDEVRTSPPSLERGEELAYNRQQQPPEVITRIENANNDNLENNNQWILPGSTTANTNNNSAMVQTIVEPIHVVAVSTDVNDTTEWTTTITTDNIIRNATSSNATTNVGVGVSLEPIATAVATRTTADGVVASNGTEVTVTEPVVVVRDHYVRMTEEEQIYHDMVELLQTDPARAAYYYRHAVIRERRQQLLLYQQVSAVYEEHLRSRQQQDQQGNNNSTATESRQRPVREWIQRHLHRLQQQNQQQEQQGQQVPQRNNSITGVLLRRHSFTMGAGATTATGTLAANRTGRPRPVRRRPRRGSDEYIDQTVAETDYSTNQPTVTDAADHTMTQHTQSYSQNHPIIQLTVSNTNTNTTTTTNGSTTARNTNLNNNLNQYPFPDPFARLILKTKVYRSSTTPTNNNNKKKKDSTVESLTTDAAAAIIDTDTITAGANVASEITCEMENNHPDDNTNVNVINTDDVITPVKNSCFDTSDFGIANGTIVSSGNNNNNSLQTATNSDNVVADGCIPESLGTVESPIESTIDASPVAGTTVVANNSDLDLQQTHPNEDDMIPNDGEEYVGNDDIEHNHLTRANVTNNHNINLDDDLNSPNNTEVCCAICLTRLEDGDVIGDIPCGHLLHKDCLKDWLKRKNRCPLCQLSGVARLHDPVTGAFAFPTAEPTQTGMERAATGALLPYYSTSPTNQRFGASDGSSSWNTSSLFSSSSSTGDFRI